MCLSLLCWIGLGDYSNRWWAFGITDLLFNLIILAGVFAVFTEWRRQVVFIVIALLAVLFQILAFLIPDAMWIVTSYACSGIFFVLLARQVVKHIFKDGPMNFYRIQGSIIVFFVVGLVYAFVYAIMETLWPRSLVVVMNTHESIGRFSELLYFSFVTMSTMGIGDVVPVSPVAKALVVFQGLFGLLYPVVMIARLVSLEISHSQVRR